MKSSPTSALPLLLVGVCLMSVFFARLNQMEYLPAAGQQQYQVRTRFALLKPPSIQENSAASTAPEDEKRWREEEFRIITSPEMLRHVIERLTLAEDWEISFDEASARVRRMLQFKLEPGTAIVSLTARGSDKIEIKYIAEAVRDSYEEYRNNEVLETVNRLRLKGPARVAARMVKPIEIMELITKAEPVKD